MSSSLSKVKTLDQIIENKSTNLNQINDSKIIICQICKDSPKCRGKRKHSMCNDDDDYDDDNNDNNDNNDT